MDTQAPIMVTWNCGHCDIIHEQTYTEEQRGDCMTLCAMIVMNEDDPDFNVRVLRDGTYVDETNSVIVALVVQALGMV